MRNTLYVLLVLAITCVNAQGNLLAQDESATLQIDQQIWEPFRSSFKDFDASTFNALHADDMLRISGSGVRGASEYRKKNTQWFQKAKSEGYQREIDFVFEQRVSTDSIAHETGYYRIDKVNPDGVKSTHFARFHVLLVHRNGRWLIKQDWDSDEINGQKVNAEQFYRLSAEQNAEPLYIIIDFVEVLDGHQEEALFYYQNNWKAHRDRALARGVICSYELLQSPAEDEDGYDILLVTKFCNKQQYDDCEKNFEPLIKMHGERRLLNELEPSSFRKIVKSMTLHGGSVVRTDE